MNSRTAEGIVFFSCRVLDVLTHNAGASSGDVARKGEGSPLMPEGEKVDNSVKINSIQLRRIFLAEAKTYTNSW